MGGQFPLWIYKAVRAVYQVSYKNLASMAGSSNFESAHIPPKRGGARVGYCPRLRVRVLVVVGGGGGGMKRNVAKINR